VPPRPRSPGAGRATLDATLRPADTGRGMSQKKEIVRLAHAALNVGNIDELVTLCEQDFQLDTSDRVLNPATYHGHDGIRRFFSEVQDVWERYVCEPEEMRDEGGIVLALLRTKGRGRASGVEIERKTAMVWAVRGGKAFWLRFYREPEKALEAVGLRG
jgi:ketosteroid isomerase-like protein